MTLRERQGGQGHRKVLHCGGLPGTRPRSELRWDRGGRPLEQGDDGRRTFARRGHGPRNGEPSTRARAEDFAGGCSRTSRLDAHPPRCRSRSLRGSSSESLTIGGQKIDDKKRDRKCTPQESDEEEIEDLITQKQKSRRQRTGAHEREGGERERERERESAEAGRGWRHLALRGA